MKTTFTPIFFGLIAICLILSGIQSHAQNYLVSFEASGAASTIDSVRVQNLTQCTSVLLMGGDVLHLVPTLGLDDLALLGSQNLHIWPNPMSEYCSINFSTQKTGFVSIIVYDISGKTIVRESIFLGHGLHRFNLSGIKPGIFIINIITENGTFNRKIVSQSSSEGPVNLQYSGFLPTQSDASIQSKTAWESDKAIVDMAFSAGDLLLLKGISGMQSTVRMLLPISDQTVNFEFIPCTDGDGNNYPVVRIGNAWWTAQNLVTTKYNNGTEIPNVTDNTTWHDITTGACCDFDNYPANSSIHGKLYNWYALETQMLCPTGWHASSDDEWETMVDDLGGMTVAGGSLKMNCNELWLDPNVDATNIVGFSALPGGGRNNVSAFNNLYESGAFWTATESESWSAWGRYIHSGSATMQRLYGFKQAGLSVRCIKD